MSLNFWKGWFEKEPRRDPRFKDWKTQNKCARMLLDPEYIKYDPYHAALAKERLDEFYRLYNKWCKTIDWKNTYEVKTDVKPEDRVDMNEVALILFEAYDHMEKIDAARDRAKKFE